MTEFCICLCIITSLIRERLTCFMIHVSFNFFHSTATVSFNFQCDYLSSHQSISQQCSLSPPENIRKPKICRANQLTGFYMIRTLVVKRLKSLPKMRKLFQTVCSCHVTYAFQSESTLYSCLNVKKFNNLCLND